MAGLQLFGRPWWMPLTQESGDAFFKKNIRWHVLHNTHTHISEHIFGESCSKRQYSRCGQEMRPTWSIVRYGILWCGEFNRFSSSVPLLSGLTGCPRFGFWSGTLSCGQSVAWPDLSWYFVANNFKINQVNQLYTGVVHGNIDISFALTTNIWLAFMSANWSKLLESEGYTCKLCGLGIPCNWSTRTWSSMKSLAYTHWSVSSTSVLSCLVSGLALLVLGIAGDILPLMFIGMGVWAPASQCWTSAVAEVLHVGQPAAKWSGGESVVFSVYILQNIAIFCRGAVICA